jgi:hypothetical protein
MFKGQKNVQQVSALDSKIFELSQFLRNSTRCTQALVGRDVDISQYVDLAPLVYPSNAPLLAVGENIGSGMKISAMRLKNFVLVDASDYKVDFSITAEKENSSASIGAAQLDRSLPLYLTLSPVAGNRYKIVKCGEEEGKQSDPLEEWKESLGYKDWPNTIVCTQASDGRWGGTFKVPRTVVLQLSALDYKDNNDKNHPLTAAYSKGGGENGAEAWYSKADGKLYAIDQNYGGGYNGGQYKNNPNGSTTQCPSQLKLDGRLLDRQ